MGLLDLFNSPDARLGIGLLAAAGPSAAPQSFGQRMSGLLGQLDAQKAADEERKARAEQQAMQRAMQQAQLQQLQEARAERQAQAAAQAAAAQRAQQFRGALMGQTAVSPQQALAAGGGPTPANASQIGAPRAPDWNALAMQHPEQIELIKKLAEARNFGRAEVARTVDGTDPQGRPATMQFDKFGNQVGQALQQWKAPERIDTGGQINIWDPVAQRTLQTLGKTNTPDALLGAQTAMRGQNMTDARSRDANQVQAAAAGKVEWKQDVNGSWIALPKEVSGAGPVTPIAVAAPGKREQQAQNALGIIDQAAKLIDKGTSSYLGAGADQVARVFGTATEGSTAAAQLKALEGALMMAQPRMEGPQSDKDTALYRQMAAQIGDSTVPANEKKAALGVVRELHQRYAGGSPGSAPGLPDASAIDAELHQRYAGGSPGSAPGLPDASAIDAELRRRNSTMRTGAW